MDGSGKERMVPKTGCQNKIYHDKTDYCHEYWCVLGSLLNVMDVFVVRKTFLDMQMSPLFCIRVYLLTKSGIPIRRHDIYIVSYGKIQEC